MAKCILCGIETSRVEFAIEYDSIDVEHTETINDHRIYEEVKTNVSVCSKCLNQIEGDLSWD